MTAKKKVVHVVGTGTIGEPLIGLLADYREPLGIDEVTFHKRTPLVTDRSKCINLKKRGAKLAVDDAARPGFLDLGIEPAYETEEAFDRASVVIDCTPSGVGIANKNEFYKKYEHNTLGFIAQGSEFGFGMMYARGINDQALTPGETKYVQVVSCNTHNISLLVNTIALEGGKDNLVEGRFLCMRRANDISQQGGFIPSPEVGGHKEARFGTHHARDAWHLFQTLDLDLDLYSSAVKLNTQYMHMIHFDIKLKNPVTLEELHKRFHRDDRISVTHKKSASQVFSFGRDYGHYGRILNETVIALPSLAMKGDREIVGFCFTPQDGNSLLSSVSAATWFLHPNEYDQRVQCLKDLFFQEV